MNDEYDEYTVTICHACGHPGGQHLDGRCRLCRDCPGWDEGECGPGCWSDRMTDEARALLDAT